jgi:hypothetical protein
VSGLRDAQLRRALRGDVLVDMKRLEWDEYNAEADRTWKPIFDLSGLEACVALEHVGLVGNHAGLPARKDLRIAGAPAAADDSVLELFRARGIRIDGVGRVGAAAAWTVTAVELEVFEPT